MNPPANSTDARSTAVNLGPIEAAVRSVLFSVREAQVRWAATPVSKRLAGIRELRRLIAAHALPLAEASASARQRPALESLTAEVLPLAEACRFLEREAQAILDPRRIGWRGRPLWLAGVRSEVRREPLGVILIIGPGNYPLLLPGVQLIQALVAGNAVLLKPGVGGTATAQVFHELVVRAGFDSRLVALLPESSEAARAAIKAGPDKVIFTGSAATGEKILAQLAPHLIPATMELSGCDALVVRADADLDLVVKSIEFGLTLNAGATCLAPKRVFVHRSIATELEGRLARAFNTGAPVSNPTRTNGFAGSEAGAPIHELLTDAVSRGAHFITGGFTSRGAIQFPVILAGVDSSARLLREDVFAPVLSLITVGDDADACASANDCPYALGVAIFTAEECAARSMVPDLRAGVVTINDLILPTADARLPFGGRRRSGFGVTRGAEGLLELTAAKVVATSRGKFRPALEPPHPNDEAVFRAYLELAHGRGLLRRARALVALFKSLSGRNRPRKKQTP